MTESEFNPSLYTMYLRTTQAQAIRTLSEALKEILTDVNFYFDPSGLKVLHVDKNRTIFTHLKLHHNKFNDYHCPKYVSVGINMLSLHKLLKTISNSDIISFYIYKNDNAGMWIMIENEEKKFVSKARYKLIDFDDEKVDIPSVKFDIAFTMTCADFQKHCRDLSSISNHIYFYTKNNGNIFSMVAEGDFADKEIKIGEPPINDNTNLQDEEESDENRTFIGKYGIKELSLVCKSSGLCSTIEIFLKENTPLVITYSVANMGQIKYGIAPKAIDG